VYKASGGRGGNRTHSGASTAALQAAPSP